MPKTTIAATAARLENAIAKVAVRLRRDEKRYRTTLEAYSQLVAKRNADRGNAGVENDDGGQ